VTRSAGSIVSEEPFEKSDDFYRRCDGLPIALVVRARKRAA